MSEGESHGGIIFYDFVHLKTLDSGHSVHKVETHKLRMNLCCTVNNTLFPVSIDVLCPRHVIVKMFSVSNYEA